MTEEEKKGNIEIGIFADELIDVEAPILDRALLSVAIRETDLEDLATTKGSPHLHICYG